MNGRRYRVEYGATERAIWILFQIRLGSRFLRKIERLQSRLQGDIKRLRRADVAYRLRLGNYRILFDVEGNVIVIRRIGDRKQIYD
jgi:mRNA interferase RelE/StbE